MKYKTCTEYWLDPSTYRFRGDFESMYKDIDDPWGCLATASSLNNRVFCRILFDDRKYDRILDLGCGLGGLSNHVYLENGGDVLGCDISASAIEKAKTLFPHISFRQFDICKDDIQELGKFDLVIVSEILWYILDDLKKTFSKIESLMNKNGIIGIHQYFPNDQNFGMEIIDGIEGFDQFIKSNTALDYSSKFVSYCHDGRVLLATLKKIGV